MISPPAHIFLNQEAKAGLTGRGSALKLGNGSRHPFCSGPEFLRVANVDGHAPGLHLMDQFRGYGFEDDGVAQASCHAFKLFQARHGLRLRHRNPVIPDQAQAFLRRQLCSTLLFHLLNEFFRRSASDLEVLHLSHRPFAPRSIAHECRQGVYSRLREDIEGQMIRMVAVQVPEEILRGHHDRHHGLEVFMA